MHIGVVSHLADSKEGPACIEIRETELNLVPQAALVGAFNDLSIAIGSVLQILLLLELLEHLLEGERLSEVVYRGDSDLHLVISSGVGYDLPVVDALFKADVSKEVPEDVFVLLDVDVPSVRADLNPLLDTFLTIKKRELLLDTLSIPNESRDDHSNDFSWVGDGTNEVLLVELLPVLVTSILALESGLSLVDSNSLSESLLFCLSLLDLLGHPLMFLCLFVRKVLLNEQ